jgi:hypothetical protein
MTQIKPLYLIKLPSRPEAPTLKEVIPSTKNSKIEAWP